MAEEKIGEALPVTRHLKIHCEVGNYTCCHIYFMLQTSNP